MQAVAQAKPRFDPKTIVRDVRIVTSDYVAQVLLPDTIRHFNQACPNVSLVHVALSDEAIADFERGDLDAMIVPVGPAFCEKYPYREIFAEQWACIARQGNTAIGTSLTAGEYYLAPHVGPSFKQYIVARTWPPPVDILPRAVAHLPFSAIPRLIADTDYIAIIPERLAKMSEQQLALRRIELVPPPPAVKFAMFWHPERSMDAFLIWMLDQMVEVGTRLGP
jgi:DNA-binding transcriptional LysR family regulator